MATIVYRYFGNVIEKVEQPDASALYGDVVFSTFRAFGSLVPWWEHHLERLRHGAFFLVAHPDWDLLLHNLNEGKSKFIQHFQGQEWMGRPTIRRVGEKNELMFFAWGATALQANAQKLAVALSERKRTLPKEVKGGDYIIETQGRQWANEMGMDDILFWQGPKKEITETSTSNIFLVNHRGEIFTPAMVNGNCLAGIVREQVILLAKRLGLQLQEKEIYLAELGRMREAFLTNCGQLIRPISQIGNCFFSSEHDNSLTNKLNKLILINLK